MYTCRVVVVVVVVELLRDAKLMIGAKHIAFFRLLLCRRHFEHHFYTLHPDVLARTLSSRWKHMKKEQNVY